MTIREDLDMLQPRLLRAAATPLLLVCLISPVVGQIYTWVDSKGNIHFGDKPREASEAETAEPVQLTESYQPADRVDEEQALFDRKQANLRRKSETFRQEEAEERRRAENERHAKKRIRCTDLGDRLATLGGVKNRDGVRIVYYSVEIDGSPVTSSRQREIIEELEQQYVEAGC